MEQHGKNPQQNVIAIIPARYASTRLPGKMLREVAGLPLVLHTFGQAQKAKLVSRVIVATDDQRIFDVVCAAGGEAVMTSPNHNSGSDRLAEVAAGLPEGSIIVNVQGDEPLISPDTIDRAVEALINDPNADIATTCELVRHKQKELLNGNVVKVVAGDNGYALYFSRSPMPFPREASLRWGGDPGQAIDNEPKLLANFRKHTGLYVYRREYLLKFTKLPQTVLERIEMLEQLRALENGAKIRVVDVSETSIGVDTEQDLERVRILLEDLPIVYGEGSPDDVAETSSVYVDTVTRSFRCVYPDEYLDGLSIDSRKSASLERFLRKDYHLFTARTKTGKLIGFADRGEPVLEGLIQKCQLYSIYVLPEYHDLGIGKTLFEMCSEGVESLCLDTVEESPYRRFYDHHGGTIIGKGCHAFGNEEMDTVIYAWGRRKER